MAFESPDCLNRFEGHRVLFDYPGFWELTEEPDGADLLLTVSAEGTCFWALRILADGPPPDDVLQSCVDALAEEYEDTEVTRARTLLGEISAPSREVTFSCFELLNSAMFACIRTDGITLLNWWQGTDHELESVREAFEQISRSVRILPVAGS